MNSNDKAIFHSEVIEKSQFIIGGLLTFMFGSATIACLTNKKTSMSSTTIIMGIILLLSIKLLLLGRKRKKLRENFYIYERILAKDQAGSIDKLASCLGISANKTKGNLELMIKYKYFAEAILDHESNRVILPVQSNQDSGEEYVKIEIEEADYQQPINENRKYVSITCKNCGGVNQVVKGQVQECEFCGSPINS
ncbi:MAG TPA: hypothetical protein VHQ24_07085 [Lachnospiraceae bacterium]|nr:hypothetical protein [Lachnospiraceae bacterium]